RKHVDQWEEQLRPKRCLRPRAVHGTLRKETRMALTESRVDVSVPPPRIAEHASVAESVIRHDRPHGNPGPAALGERHPEIPVLVAAAKFPTARLENRLAPEHCRRRPFVQIRD